PILVPPDAHPFVIGITESHSPSPYGPVFLLLTQIPIAFTGNHWVASVIGLKLLAFVAYLTAAAFIYLTVRRLWPGRELFAALAWAWNPFVVFRVAGNGHNDALMMAFALAALYFTSRQFWRLALPLLALSVCVKFTMALLVPPVVLYAWLVSDARGRRDVAVGCVLALLATAIAFVPFWAGADTFKSFIKYADKTITSVPELVSLRLQHGRSVADADRIVHFGGYAAFGVIYAALLFGLARQRTFTTLVAVCALLLAAFLVFCTWWFRPWYFLWFLALAPLLPSYWWTAVLVATSFGATFFDLIEQYRGHIQWLANTGFHARAAPVYAAFLPLVLTLLLGMAVTGVWTMTPEHDDPQGRDQRYGASA
ncbi:MAG: glycosyltransferase family 39 protein, partial [Dehalococcoidia bacterium]